MFKRMAVAAAILILLGSTAYAGTYELPELYMTVDVPDAWIVLSGDMDDDDPTLLALGISPEYIKSYMENGNIYFDALHPDFSRELVVIKVENEAIQNVFNLVNVTQKELESFAQGILHSAEAKQTGVSYLSHSFHKAGEVSYVVLNFTGGVGAYGQQYCTVYNGQAVNFILHSYAGEITDEDAAALKGVVDSVTFTKTLENPNPRKRGIDWSAVVQKALAGAVGGAVLGGLAFLIKRGRGKKVAADTARGMPAPEEIPEQAPPPRLYTMSAPEQEQNQDQEPGPEQE